MTNNLTIRHIFKTWIVISQIPTVSFWYSGHTNDRLFRYPLKTKNQKMNGNSHVIKRSTWKYSIISRLKVPFLKPDRPFDSWTLDLSGFLMVSAFWGLSVFWSGLLIKFLFHINWARPHTTFLSSINWGFSEQTRCPKSGFFSNSDLRIVWLLNGHMTKTTIFDKWIPAWFSYFNILN